MKNKALRVDLDFEKELREISLERYMKGRDKKILSPNILTNKMIKSSKYKELKEDLLKEDFSLLKRKGGYVSDLVLLLLIPFILLIILGALYYAFNLFYGVFHGIQFTGLPGGTNVTQITEDTIGKVILSIEQLKTLTVIIFFMMGVSLFIFNYLNRINPIFSLGYILVSVVLIIASAYISNSYENLLKLQGIGEALQGFSGANFIMANLPVWFTIFAMIGLIFLIVGGTKPNKNVYEGVG